VNEQYYKPNPLEDLFTRFFRAPQEDEPCLQLSASQLMSQLSRRSPSLLRTVSETAFGKMLRRLGIPKDHQHDGNVYRVVTL